MKPSISKVKNMRGRINGYTASIGPIKSALYPIPNDAANSCEALAHDALMRLDRGTRVFRWRNHTIVISPTTTGWDYWIDTFERTDYTVSCYTREDAENSALSHLAQSLWELNADDATFLEGLPPSVQRTLSGWIAFQRGYAAAKASGLSDTEAHRAGCELKSAVSS